MSVWSRRLRSERNCRCAQNKLPSGPGRGGPASVLASSSLGGAPVSDDWGYCGRCAMAPKRRGGALDAESGAGLELVSREIEFQIEFGVAAAGAYVRGMVGVRPRKPPQRGWI